MIEVPSKSILLILTIIIIIINTVQSANKNNAIYSVPSQEDGKNMIVSRYVSANETYLYVFNLQTHELTEIEPSKEKISHGGAVWSFDNKGIYFSSDQNSDFKNIKYYDIKTKKAKSFIPFS